MALTVSATDSEVPKPINAAYNQTLLRNARPLAAYYIGSQPGVMRMHGGTATIGWRRFNTSADDSSGPAPSVTALSEITGNAAYGMGRTPITVHRTDQTADVSKYGQFFYVNEEVQIYNFTNTTDGIVQVLAILAGRSMNQLQRNVLEDNLTQRYAGNVASDGAVGAVTAVGDLDRSINELSTNFAMVFTPMREGSRNIGTVPIHPAFWAFCHPHVAHDLEGLAGFATVEKYAGQVDVVMGEIGTYANAGFGCRFIATPEASIDAGAGAATSGDFRATSSVNDLYTIVIIGREAHGAVGLGRQLPDGRFVSGEGNPQDVIKLIVKGMGTDRPSGLDDPFDEMTSFAYKFFHAGRVLNSNWGRAIRVAATNLEN